MPVTVINKDKSSTVMLIRLIMLTPWSLFIERLYIDIAIPDLSATFELQGQYSCRRAIGRIVIDTDSNDIAIDKVHECVPASDYLQLVPFPIETFVRFYELRRIVRGSAYTHLLLIGQQFHDPAWEVNNASALTFLQPARVVVVGIHVELVTADLPGIRSASAATAVGRWRRYSRDARGDRGLQRGDSRR